MQRVKFLSLVVLFIFYLSSSSLYGESLENLHSLVEKLSPSVVRIETTSIGGQDSNITGDPFFDEFFNRQFGDNLKPRYGLGSGFIYSNDGFIVTNLHVVERANDISIVLIDGSKHKAKIIGTDKTTDLALLKIDIQNPINKVKVGNSDSLKIGEWVVAIGNPLGLGTTVTTGIVSAKGRYIDGLDSTYVDFIQTDAALNRGNSGGPLFNLRGEVIGVNTAIATRGQGIGFAIPINMAIDVIEELKINGKVERGWLGIIIQKINPGIADSLKLGSTKGALVTEVLVDGPAFKAGLKRGDIILSLNNKQIDDMEDLPREVGKLKPQTLTELEVLRAGEQININVRLGELPSTQISKKQRNENQSRAKEKFGFEAKGFQDDSNPKNNKVIVTRVYPNSNAHSLLLKGDIILEINRHSISDINKFNSVLKNIKPDENCLFLIQRQTQNRFITLYKSIRSIK